VHEPTRQLAVWHTFAAGQSVTTVQQPAPAVVVFTQVPVGQVSVVHGLPSLQSAGPAHAQVGLTTGRHALLLHMTVAHLPGGAAQSEGTLHDESASSVAVGGEAEHEVMRSSASPAPARDGVMQPPSANRITASLMPREPA